MLLDARPLRDKRIEELRQKVEELPEVPKLVLIRVGNDPASIKYVGNKKKLCEQVGVESVVVELPEQITQDELEDKVNYYSTMASTTGILLQLPLPKHIDEERILNLIDPDKEVDGFSVVNLGKLMRGEEAPVACTPKGIIELLKHYQIPMEGKNVLIINRSNIVGKPLAQLFLRENATVTIAHSRTNKEKLKEMLALSDIVVTGIGRAGHFKSADFQPNTTIVDVSINVNEQGKLCGDVDKESYDRLVTKNCNITPVPGGVGIMTVLSLIEQVIEMKVRELEAR